VWRLILVSSRFTLVLCRLTLEPQRLNWKHGGFIGAIDADLEPQSLPGTKESYYRAVCRSSSMDAHPVDEETHHIVQ
jgi:hypothetical protein